MSSSTEQHQNSGYAANAFTEAFMLSALKEQRSARRWRVFFRFMILLYVGAVLALAMGLFNTSSQEENAHIATVDVRGMIADQPGGTASAEKVIEGLKRAFEAENAKAVFILINSPGGSPVQSAQIYREILRLRAEHSDMPVYALGSDTMASGAYYIASAADQIYADPTSIVGSVGVIMSGFGFTEVMDKLGVERRVHTAGESKAFMDPFAEETPESLAHIDQMLSEIHGVFIDDVKRVRGEKIKLQDSEVFNGLVWTGVKALEIGLIDGLGSPGEVGRDKFSIEKFVDYSVRPNPFDAFASKMSTELMSQASLFIQQRFSMTAQ